MNNEYIEDVYERRSDMVYRVCFSYMKNAPEAEDVVADVFTKLFYKSGGFKSDEHEKAWLLRTAINQCKNSLKHWRRKSSNIDDYRNLAEEPPHEFQQEIQMLELVLALPMRYKDVIYLYYYEGYATREIAEILQKPHSTVRYHMREARRLLKEQLGYEE